MNSRHLLSLVTGDSTGSMTIELAAVAPILVLMSIGTFEVSKMVSRQHELQSAASEGETIALAASASGETTTITAIEDIIETSMDLDDNQVTVSRFFRCDAEETVISAPNAAAACTGGEVVTSYLKLELSDTYTPVWTQFGIGEPFDYDVERMVQL